MKFVVLQSHVRGSHRHPRIPFGSIPASILTEFFHCYNDDAERKKQKIARAVDVEYRKRAGVREGRADNLNAAL
jgi:hypothetical protein